MLCFVFSFILGYLIFSLASFDFKSKKTINTFFYTTTIGFIFQILTYSIFKSHFITVNSLVLVLFLYILFNRLKENNYSFKFEIQKFEFKKLVYVLIPIGIIFTWKYYCLFNENKDFPIVINSDSIYHSNLSIFLQKFGVENLNTNHFMLPDGTYPYHYFEAWTIAYFSEILNLNHWITEELVVYPLFASLTILGIYSIMEKFNFLNIFTSIGAIFVLNFSGVYTILLNSNLDFLQYKDTYAFSYNALDEFWCLKLVVIYLLITIVMNLFFDNKHYTGTIVLIATSFFSITIFLGFSFGILMFLVLSWFIRGRITYYKPKEIRNLIIINVLTVISILLFYYTTESTYNFIIKPSIKQVLIEINDLTKVKIKIMYFIIRLLQLVLIYSPSILISFFFIRKFHSTKNLNLLYLLFGLFTSITFSSLIIWVLLDFSFGSKGYFFYSILPIYNVLSVLSILLTTKYLVNKKIKLLFFSIYLFIGILNCEKTVKTYTENKKNLWDSFSKKFIYEVYKDSRYIRSNYGARIEGVNFFNNSITNDNIDYLGYFMSGFYSNSDNFKITTSISAGYANLNSTEVIAQTKKYIQAMPIYNFYKIHNKNNLNDFIKKHNISYILVNKNEKLNNEIKFKKKIFDNKSGITYYRIN